jgi:integrase
MRFAWSPLLSASSRQRAPALRPGRAPGGACVARAPVADVGRAEALLEALKPLERAAWALFIYAGLRRGEARALRVSDVDLDAGSSASTVTSTTWTASRTPRRTRGVARSRSRARCAGSSLSTRAPRRRPDRHHGDCAVRTNDTAAPCPQGVEGREARTANAARRTPRRTSFLLAAGVSLLEVSRYVGHTDVRTTANVYGHLVAGQDTSRQAPRRAARAPRCATVEPGFGRSHTSRHGPKPPLGSQDVAWLRARTRFEIPVAVPREPR